MSGETPSAQAKQSWTFDRNLNDPELRSVHALEHIAHYLDRIDGSLDRIAASLETGNVNEKLRSEISSIAHMLPRLLEKRP
jgi:hypothetical protein